MAPVTYPHRIRLRGPWECTPLSWQVRLENGQVAHLDSIPPEPQTVTMPCRWCAVGWGNFTGVIHCQRRFGRPARLDAWERVWLTFAGVSDRAVVSLNGQELGLIPEGGGPTAFPLVQAALQERNRLEVVVASYGAEGGLWGEVALEIRRGEEQNS